MLCLFACLFMDFVHSHPLHWMHSLFFISSCFFFLFTVLAFMHCGFCGFSFPLAITFNIVFALNVICHHVGILLFSCLLKFFGHFIKKIYHIGALCIYKFRDICNPLYTEIMWIRMVKTCKLSDFDFCCMFGEGRCACLSILESKSEIFWYFWKFHTQHLPRVSIEW